MAEQRPEWGDRWIARGLMLAGLWLAGTGIWDIVRSMPIAWDQFLAQMPKTLGGIFFLAGAWKMRAAIRWDPPEDE